MSELHDYTEERKHSKFFKKLLRCLMALFVTFGDVVVVSID